jgi:hypothetical protein
MVVVVAVGRAMTTGEVVVMAVAVGSLRRELRLSVVTVAGVSIFPVRLLV